MWICWAMAVGQALCSCRSSLVVSLAWLSLLSILQLFHEAAYMADDRQDLLNAINEFLDCSIVIPPSEVEGKDLLRSIATFQKELLRKRKEREQKKSTKEGVVQEAKGLLTLFLADNEFASSVSLSALGGHNGGCARGTG